MNEKAFGRFEMLVTSALESERMVEHAGKICLADHDPLLVRQNVFAS
jgi:hypothetical protein